MTTRIKLINVQGKTEGDATGNIGWKRKANLIITYKLINQIEKVENVDLLLTKEGETREMRGHKSKLRKGKWLNNVNKFSFPQRNVDI